MGIKKKLAIGAVATLGLSAGQASTLPETTKSVQKDIEKNIKHTPSKPKASTLDLTELFSKSPGKEKTNKDKDVDSDEKKIEQAKIEWSGYKGVTNVTIGEDLNYTEFTYNNEYKIKYENTGVDIIHITPLQENGMEYSFEFMSSLFKENIIDHIGKDSTEHKKEVTKRLEYCITAQKLIAEQCKKEDRELNQKKKPYVKLVQKEFKTYIAVKRLIEPKEEGYKKGKQEKDKFYYVLQLGKESKDKTRTYEFKPIPLSTYNSNYSPAY